MLDQEIADVVRLRRAPDRIAYTCGRCQGTTYAPGGLTAITCSHCGRIDLGTELARNRWRMVCEIRLADKPTATPTPKPLIHPADLVAMVVGIALLLAVWA